jgi:hypothetical protein
MHEQVVSERTARLAKLKGFKEYTEYWYPSFHKYELIRTISPKILIDYELGNSFLAPTQAFLQQWLRETHNLYIDIRTDQTTAPKFCYELVKYEDYGNWEKILNVEWYLYRTYEEALEEALFFTLKQI